MMIDIGDDVIPAGWEFVAFRKAVDGDYWISHLGSLCCGESRGREFIVRTAFAWPECIKPGVWYAMDANGGEWLHEHKPQLDHSFNRITGSTTLIRREILDFPPAPVPPERWRESLRQKPVNTKELANG